MGGRIAFVLALTACTPTAAEQEPSEPPPGASPVDATPATATATTNDDACQEVVDFDEVLATNNAPAADVLVVRDQLEQDNRKFISRPDELAKIFGEKLKDPLAALVPLLTDYELGDAAAHTMFAIDRERAAPIVFASMPRSDRNVQGHSFKLFIRLSFEGESICWNAIVSDAARRTLEEGTAADAAELALWALGIAGTLGDAPLLRRYLESDQGVEHWTTRIRNAAQSALARQGDETAIAAIRRELDVPVAKKMTFARAESLSMALEKAGFSRHRSFVPLLCRHLHNGGAAPDDDLLPPEPSEYAAQALGHILDNANLHDFSADVEAWMQRCAK